jgi:UDP-N-acetyl-2-amino-2-deoxyglucuronate dehydrogenase
MSTNNSKLGIGIVGTGVIAEEHAYALKQLSDECILLAAAETNPARLIRFGERFFFPFAYTNANDVLRRTDIDIVIIATPPAFHEELVVNSLQAGKYVICEKPLAHNLETADRIIATSEKYPGKLSVSYQLRYDLMTQRLKWFLTQSSPAGVTEVECHRNTPVSPAAISRGWWGKWNVAGGGVVMTQFIHQIDLICEFFGMPLWVEAQYSNSTPGLESEDWCDMRLGLRGGGIFHGNCSVLKRNTRNSFAITGDFGTLSTPWDTSKLTPKARTLQAQAESQYPRPPEPPRWRRLMNRIARRAIRELGFGHLTKPDTQPRTHTPYFQAVFDAIRREKPLPIPPQSARMPQEVVAGIYASAARGGERLEFPLSQSWLSINPSVPSRTSA